MPNLIRMYRGNDKTLALTVKDAAGTAVDLTGATIWFTVKKAASVPGAQAEFTKATANAQGGGDDQILITDPTNGKAEIYIVPSNTQNMRIRVNYFAGVQVKLGTKIYTVWVGSFGVEHGTD